MSAAAAGLLTTLPVVCFGAFAPIALRLARRSGIEVALASAMVVLAGGILLRLVPSTFALFAGTVVLGAAITAANVLLPVLVKRDFPRRVGLMTGVYVMVFSGGAALAAAATVPLTDATGWGWRPALAVWAVPAALAALMWLARAPRAAPPGPPRPVTALRWIWSDRLAWQVTLFMGLQSFGFYASVAWLPTIFVDHGIARTTAGVLLGVASLISVPASLAIPVLAAQRPSQHVFVLVTVALCGAGVLGLMLAPSAAAALWMVLLGLGQGAAIGLALTLIGLRARDDHHAAELSGMAQTVGYLSLIHI